MCVLCYFFTHQSFYETLKYQLLDNGRIKLFLISIVKRCFYSFVRTCSRGWRKKIALGGAWNLVIGEHAIVYVIATMIIGSKRERKFVRTELFCTLSNTFFNFTPAKKVKSILATLRIFFPSNASLTEGQTYFPLEWKIYSHFSNKFSQNTPIYQ